MFSSPVVSLAWALQWQIEKLTISEISSLDEMSKLALVETSSWVGQLEWPEEVGGLLEVWTDSEDLVDKILDTDDTKLAEGSLNKGVVGESNALLVDLSVSTLVDELADGLEVGVSVGDERLNDLQHLAGSLGKADEDTVVDLEETEELEGLALLGVNLVDTAKY